jgi:hypothetical protein
MKATNDLTPKKSNNNLCDFDIHRLYHDAVERIVQYDVEVNSLHRELSLKEERIVCFGKKLVAISLELASSKALVDELSQQLHRLKQRMSRMDSDDVGECSTQERSTKVQRLYSCPESPVVVCFPINNTLINEAMNSTHDDMPRVPYTPMRNRNQLKREESNNKICDDQLSRRWQSISCDSYVGRESTFFVSNSNRVAMPNAPETAPRRSSGDRHLRQSWKNALNGAYSSSIGQILGLNKNDCRDSKESSTDEEDSPENSYTKAKGLAKTESRSSPQIEGVIFPVSSEEVLDAILLDRTGFACPKSVSSFSNEEWPEYDKTTRACLGFPTLDKSSD